MVVVMYEVAWLGFTGMQREYYHNKAEALARFEQLESIGFDPYFYED